MTSQPTNPTTLLPQVVYTDSAHCRDCYRCVRTCPVKAIRMEDAQASVVDEYCLACGTCIRQCPQHAKRYRNDILRAEMLLKSGKPVAVSVAPSLASTLSEWQRRALPSVLRSLGFARVAETAVGAYHVAKETLRYVQEHPGRTHLCSACPAVVSLIEQYHPEWADALVPVVSPMIAHARMLREELGQDCGVVFIGPCVAKKKEAQRAELAGAVDVVLTFEELLEWMKQRELTFEACEESTFDELPAGEARSFPVEGGLLLTAGLSTDMLSADVLAISGYEEIIDLLQSLPKQGRSLLVEPLFCRQGCINGPALAGGNELFTRRGELLEYSCTAPRDDQPVEVDPKQLAAEYKPVAQRHDAFTEDAIRAVLAKTGKTTPADELNCGCCGYDTCREKAIAVLKGLAVPEMCVPYMRRMAEQRTDRIIETSPNGIIILDEHGCVLQMNPAFTRMFVCSEAMIGKPISTLMDPDMFEKAAGHDGVFEAVVRHDTYNLIAHQVVYRLAEEKQCVGIFVNITSMKNNQRALDDLRQQTVTQAKQLLEQQEEMAQQIAEYLG